MKIKYGNIKNSQGFYVYKKEKRKFLNFMF